MFKKNVIPHFKQVMKSFEVLQDAPLYSHCTIVMDTGDLRIKKRRVAKKKPAIQRKTTRKTTTRKKRPQKRSTSRTKK